MGAVEIIERYGIAGGLLLLALWSARAAVRWFFRTPNPADPRDMGGYGHRLLEALISYINESRRVQDQQASSIAQQAAAMVQQISVDQRLEESIKGVISTLAATSDIKRQNHAAVVGSIGELARMIEMLAVAAGKDVTEPMERLRAIIRDSSHSVPVRPH